MFHQFVSTDTHLSKWHLKRFFFAKIWFHVICEPSGFSLEELKIGLWLAVWATCCYMGGWQFSKTCFSTISTYELAMNPCACVLPDHLHSCCPGLWRTPGVPWLGPSRPGSAHRICNDAGASGPDPRLPAGPNQESVQRFRERSVQHRQHWRQAWHPDDGHVRAGQEWRVGPSLPLNSLYCSVGPKVSFTAGSGNNMLQPNIRCIFATFQISSLWD